MMMIGPLYFPDQEKHFQAFAEDIEGYQKPQRDKAMEYVTDWSCALDGGANVGIFARHFAQRFEKVIAVDPLDANIECLKLNTPENVEIIQAALGDAPGPVQMYTGGSTLGHAFIKSRADIAIPGVSETKLSNPKLQQSAHMITIDSLKLERLGLIKLDIQGAEVIALRGAMKTIARCKPVILIEEKPLGSAKGSTQHITEGTDLLTELGMTRVTKVGADSIFCFL